MELYDPRNKQMYHSGTFNGNAVTMAAGLADGIDAMAMKSALSAGGTVVGILGCGAEQAAQIVEIIKKEQAGELSLEAGNIRLFDQLL